MKNLPIDVLTPNPIFPLLSVRHLTADFVDADGRSLRAIEDVSFDVFPGQTLGIVGESGCGKTTTMLAILRLLPASGRIVRGAAFLNGVDLIRLSDRELRSYRWKELAMVFQSAMNALNPVIRVGDQIREAILQHDLMDYGAADRRVEELLDLVGIARNRKDQYPHQYSGGMRQRAMIAMSLACRPKILFADEPTTALDVMIQAQVLELLKKIQSELGLAVVLVTHDLGVVAEICDTVVVMYGGQVAEYGPADAVYNHPGHPYTQKLLEAFPDLNRPGEGLISIPGSPPRLNALPPGCRFEPRCHLKISLCSQLGPHLQQVASTGIVTPGSIHTPHIAACHLLEHNEASP